MITQDDVKRALDNCMWEHIWGEGQQISDLPDDVRAVGHLYVDMVAKRRNEVTEQQAGATIVAAVDKWKNHRRSPLRLTPDVADHCQ